MRKKKALINALVCTAKIATISIPNAFFQVLLQESFDLGKDVLLEFPDEMPHIDDFSTSPAMTNIVEDILAETNVLDNLEDLCGLHMQHFVATLVQQSTVVKHISQDEEHQAETVLTNYLQALKQWAILDPTFLLNCFENVCKKLSLQEKQIEHLHDESKEHEYRLTALENSKSDSSPSLESISGDTEYYSQKYTEALFLHRRLPAEKRITLKDIYTLPGAGLEDKYQWSKILYKNNTNRMDLDHGYSSIADAIRDFLEYAPQSPSDPIVDILFIEGNAAIGKSSLISWLCWHYLHSNEHKPHQEFTPLNEILGKYRLISVKLRDIPRSGVELLNINSPFQQLCAYLLNTSEQELQSKQKSCQLKNIFNNTILILEGFDELCMFDNAREYGRNHYFQNLYRELQRLECECKIIVTSRPEYLKVEQLDFPKAHLMITPFNREKRQRYLNKYESFSKNSLDAKYQLINGNSPSFDGIIESPLTLYMIIARNVQVSDDSNLWYIYNEIFAREVFERNYEKEGVHAIHDYRHLLYRLTAEIACALSKEEHFSTTVDKLMDNTQIRNLIDIICEGTNKNLPEIIEDCYGLASYFRVSENMSLEFYHNNIKDYFYCEYLWLRLEEIYSNIPSDPHERDRWFIGSFQELFQHSIELKDQSDGIRSKPLDFLESKVRYLKEQQMQADFIIQEVIQKRYFTHFFGKMLQTGFIDHYEYSGDDNLLHMMARIYAAVFSIYRTIYTPYLSHNERIQIAETAQVVDISTSFIFRILLPLSNIHDLSRICFDGIMLSYLSFLKVNLQNCSFCGCLLIGCEFDGCDLRGADFSGASLEYADFRNAILDDTTVFSRKTKFGYTKINHDQKQYFTPWVNDGLFFEASDSVTYIGPLNYT